MANDQFLAIVYIGAPQAKVWEALTHAHLTRQFMFGQSVDSDWREGSDWSLSDPDGTVNVRGTVLEVARPARLRLSWETVATDDGGALPESTVTYLLESIGEITKFSLSELYAAPVSLEVEEAGREGWALIMSGLKTLLETGQPLRLSLGA